MPRATSSRPHQLEADSRVDGASAGFGAIAWCWGRPSRTKRKEQKGTGGGGKAHHPESCADAKALVLHTCPHTGRGRASRCPLGRKTLATKTKTQRKKVHEACFVRSYSANATRRFGLPSVGPQPQTDWVPAAFRRRVPAEQERAQCAKGGGKSDENRWAEKGAGEGTSRLVPLFIRSRRQHCGRSARVAAALAAPCAVACVAAGRAAACRGESGAILRPWRRKLHHRSQCAGARRRWAD
mmetsp:Transcript_21967/g.68166  ORF Transcript_21967/g.68166 Transcript_21967/m.68166 type:complete len:240 (-) Transcript_21967:506-1225(-)